MASIWRFSRNARCCLSRGVRQEIVAEELLVEGAGHFGHEQRVLVVGKGLILAGEVAVHRVARLVGQREDVVEHVGLIVHEDVRVAVVRAGREGAAPLAAVLVAVAPAVGQPAFEHAAVFGSQRFQGGQHRLDRLVPGVPAPHLRRIGT